MVYKYAVVAAFRIYAQCGKMLLKGRLEAVYWIAIQDKIFKVFLLAYLSRRLKGELIVYQSVRRLSTFSNISSETTGPIKHKFHMETP